MFYIFVLGGGKGLDKLDDLLTLLPFNNACSNICYMYWWDCCAICSELNYILPMDSFDVLPKMVQAIFEFGALDS